MHWATRNTALWELWFYSIVHPEAFEPEIKVALETGITNSTVFTNKYARDLPVLPAGPRECGEYCGDAAYSGCGVKVLAYVQGWIWRAEAAKRVDN